MGGTVGCPEYRGGVHLAQAAIFGEKNMIRILASMSTHFYRGGCRGGSSEIRWWIPSTAVVGYLSPQPDPSLWDPSDFCPVCKSYRARRRTSKPQTCTFILMSTIPLQHYFPRAWRFTVNYYIIKNPRRAAPAARRGADPKTFSLKNNKKTQLR